MAVKSVTKPLAGEETALAEIWHEAWHFAHGQVVDPALVRNRTRQNFEERINQSWGRLLVARLDGEPVGMASTKPGQLYQCFVGLKGRGTGIAADLIHEAESVLASEGCEEAFLNCADGNERAMAFYRKMGWDACDKVVDLIQAGGNSFTVPCTVFRKKLILKN